MVPLAEADALVRRCVAQFEPTSPIASLPPDMVGAHVTLLSPFLPPALVDDDAVRTLRDIASTHGQHSITLSEVAVFAGGGIYLPPDPSEQLEEMTRTIWQRWPEWPPYEGRFETVVPHVTLAIVEDDATKIDAVTEFARPWLPISAEVREFQLLRVDGRRWTILERFALERPG